MNNTSAHTKPALAGNLAHNIAERQAASRAFAHNLSDVIGGMQARGMSHRAPVAELNAAGIKTHYGATWRLSILQRVLARLEEPEAAM